MSKDVLFSLQEVRLPGFGPIGGLEGSGAQAPCPREPIPVQRLERRTNLEPRLKEVQDRLTARDDWSGAVFSYGGSIIGLDLFDKPTTLAKLWPKLIRAYAIDALESGHSKTVDRSDVETWVRGLSNRDRELCFTWHRHRRETRRGSPNRRLAARR